MRFLNFQIPPAFRIVFACCAITICGLSIPINCGGLFYKAAAEELGIGLGTISLYLTIEYVITALFLPYAGKLMAGESAKKILVAAVVLDAVAFGSLGFANGIWGFYIPGAIMGFTGAILVFLAVPVLITNWFASSTGAALGIALAAGGIASAIFSPLINFLINLYSWRSAYLICGLAMTVIALPPCLMISMKPGDLGLSPWGTITSKTEEPDQGMTIQACMRSTAFWLVFFFAGMLGITSALIIHIPPFMLEAGYSSLTVSTILSLTVIGVTCGMFGVGWLNDRLGLPFAGCLGISLGILGMGLLYFCHGYVSALLGGFFYGAGSATTLVAPPLVVQRLFGVKHYARIYAWITTSVALGAAFGVSLFGYVRDFAGNYSATMSLALLLQVAGLLLFILALTLQKKTQAQWE